MPSRPRHVPALLSLGWLYAHYALHFPNLIGPFGAALVFFAAVLAGTIAGMLPSPRKRGWTWGAVSALPAAAAPLVAWFLAGAVAAALSGLEAGLLVESIPLVADRHLTILYPAYLVVVLATCFRYRVPTFAAFEPLLHGLLLIPVFWSEGQFRAGLYPHPAAFFASVLGFVAAQAYLAASSGRVGAAPRLGDLIAGAVLLLLIAFGLFSRYSDEAVAARGGLIKPELLRFDFSDYVRLESRIGLGRDLVLVYRRDRETDSRLIRRAALSGYNSDGSFFLDKNEPLAEPALTLGREVVNQEVFLVNIDPDAIVAANYPIAVAKIPPPSSRFTSAYRVRSMANVLLPFELSDPTDLGLDARTLAYYTRVADDPEITALAKAVVDGVDSYLERVLAINDFLRYEYRYSLHPGTSADGNQLRHFLFESRKGYCSYFAFAMATMCRILGIPARVALGFFLDPSTAVLGYHPVRADMAHAWVEVYFPSHGWIEFDPTSEEPAPGEEAGAPQEDSEEFIRLLEDILDYRPAGSLPTPAGPGGVPPGRPALGLIGGGVFLTALGLLLWFRVRPAFGLFAGCPRVRAAARFELVLRRLAGLGLFQRGDEHRSEFVRRTVAAGFGVAELYRIYQRARYAREFSIADERDSAAAAREIDRAFASLGPRRAVSTYLHPRTLRRRLPLG